MSYSTSRALLIFSWVGAVLALVSAPAWLALLMITGTRNPDGPALTDGWVLFAIVTTIGPPMLAGVWSIRRIRSGRISFWGPALVLAVVGAIFSLIGGAMLWLPALLLVAATLWQRVLTRHLDGPG